MSNRSYDIGFYTTKDNKFVITMNFFDACELWNAWSTGAERFNYEGTGINLEALCMIRLGDDFWHDYNEFKDK